MATPNRHTDTNYGSLDPAVPLSDLPHIDIKQWRNPEMGQRIVHEVEGRFNASWEESRYLRQFDWRRNWEFVEAGNQWIYWNAEIPDFCPLPVPEELRYTENQIRGIVRQVVNLCVQGDPAFDCSPMNSDWDSIESARMAKPYLFSKARELCLGRLRVMNVKDAALFGFGLRRTFYQPAGGGVVAEFLPTKRLAYAGFIGQEARSPWGWFPQVGREGPYVEDMEYCNDTDFVSPAWVKRAFPGIDIDTADFEPSMVMPSQLIQPGDLNWSMFGQTPNRRSPNGKVLMITYYQVPAPVDGFERGAEIRICGRKVLSVTELQTCPQEPPFACTLPYTVYAGDSRRGTFYPRPLASDLIEPQMRINQTLSHQYTHAALCSGPNLLTTKGDHLPSTASMAYEKWEIPPGVQDPRWLPPPAVPAWLFEMKGAATDALRTVSMNFGATMGERSSKDPSGYYLDVLREHDSIDLQAMVRDMARAEEQGAGMLLQLAKKFEKPEVMLNIVGANGRSAAFRFLKDKLRPEKVRVVVQATSMLPFLSTSRGRLGMEMYEKQVFGPPGQVDPKRTRALLKWIDAPGLFDLLELMGDDEILAERNHSAIIEEGMIAFPTEPREGEDPKAFSAFVEAAEAQGKGFQIDADWDPSPLLELAIARKKQSDTLQWPVEVKHQFANYVEGLKALQSSQAQVQSDASIQEQKAALGLELQGDAVKQENQAKGRAKVKLVEAAANAAFEPDPHDAVAAQAKGDMIQAVIEHALNKDAQEQAHEHNMEAAKAAPGKKEK